MRRTLTLVALLATTAGSAAAQTIYSNGFETNNSGWNVFGGAFDATRVASGTGGIPSATGSFHAIGSIPATNWGGYNFGGAPVFQSYVTSLDIYLNMSGGYANDTRFDYTSAINNAAGAHLRDFAFNAGFYNDATGPGANTNRFVISGSNNTGRANSFPKNPGRDPFAISTTGWYTFRHSFFNAGGFLGVDMSIFDSGGNLLHTWSFGGVDAIATVGGNRYGYIATNEMQSIAIDNASLTISAVPEPSAFLLVGAGLAGIAVMRRRQRRA